VNSYTVKYEIATYEGTRVVWADDEEEAIAKVRRWVRAQQPPIGHERYTVVEGPSK
jgi:hypothetical protein